MTEKNDVITIKKYANRRLYNTGTSSYVTLEDLAKMVSDGVEFIVKDAKTDQDITHSVLTQIIFEQEGKDGNALLPISFLRQLIAFYGDQMQMVVPSYLEQTMTALTQQQEQFRDKITSGLEDNPMMRNMQAPMQMVEEQVKRNTEMLQKTMQMFSPFAMSEAAKTPDTKEQKANASDIEELKAQMAQLQGKLDKFTGE